MAKAKSSYAAKLLDPRWQKKRLEIFQRDEFTCRICFEEGKTLHVHHGFYRKNTDPWDYPNRSLYTVCEECHTDVQEEMQESHELLGSMCYEEFLSTLCLLRQIKRLGFSNSCMLLDRMSDLVSEQIKELTTPGYKAGLAIIATDLFTNQELPCE